jgi:hypothetical protein
VITGNLKSKIDRIWDAFWSGGITNLKRSVVLWVKEATR